MSVPGGQASGAINNSAMPASVRTRAGAGEVRLDKASRSARPGDRLVFVLGTRVIDLTIEACGTRRGPAQEARALYRLEGSVPS